MVVRLRTWSRLLGSERFGLRDSHNWTFRNGWPALALFDSLLKGAMDIWVHGILHRKVKDQFGNLGVCTRNPTIDHIVYKTPLAV